MKNLFPFIKTCPNKSGIVMVEALMAVSLMAVAAIISGGIIESTVSTTKQSGDYLVAQNLASEALEGVKNIVNSNKIIYSNNSKCWLAYNAEECASDRNLPEVGKHYVLSFVDNRWVLEDRGSSALDLSSEVQKNSDFQLFIQEKKMGEVSYPMFTHDQDKLNTPSKFFRSITFNSISTDEGNEMASGTALVEWEDRSKIRMVSRDFIVTMH